MLRYKYRVVLLVCLAVIQSMPTEQLNAPIVLLLQNI